MLADGGMEAVVAMDPRLALLAVAVRAEPLPPPFFIVRDAGCVCEEGRGREGEA